MRNFTHKGSYMRKRDKGYRDLDEINVSEEVEFTKNDIFDDIDKMIIANRIFVLTGTFTSGKRKDIESIIKDNGGVIKKRLDGEVDYLVVGDVVSPGWKYGNYGSKIELALERKDAGDSIKIVSEQTLMKNLESSKDICSSDVMDVFLRIRPSKSFEDDDDALVIRIGLDFDDGALEIDSSSNRRDYEVRLFNALNSKVKYFDEHISEIRYLYEQLPNETKEKISDKVREKLVNFINKSLQANFVSIEDDIAAAKKKDTKIRRLTDGIEIIQKRFGDFSKLDFVKEKIDDFYTSMKKELEK